VASPDISEILCYLSRQKLRYTCIILAMRSGNSRKVVTYRFNMSMMLLALLLYIHLYSHKLQLQKQQIKKTKEKDTHNVSKNTALYYVMLYYVEDVQSDLLLVN